MLMSHIFMEKICLIKITTLLYKYKQVLQEGGASYYENDISAKEKTEI